MGLDFPSSASHITVNNNAIFEEMFLFLKERDKICEKEKPKPGAALLKKQFVLILLHPQH